MTDITRTLDAMTIRERASFHRSLESSDHFDRVDTTTTTIEFVPLTDHQRKAFNALLEEVEPGLRLGVPMSQAGAARLVGAYFTPRIIAEVLA